jgi:diaminopimelate decarboxylase
MIIFDNAISGIKRYFQFNNNEVARELYPNIEFIKPVLINSLKKHNTPIFFMDNSLVSKQVFRVKKCLTNSYPKSIIAYSLKTNYELVLQKVINPEDVWIEIVSSRELGIALKSGFPGKRIIFNGPGKQLADLKKAIACGSIIHIDNAEELRLLQVVARNFNKFIAVGIRLCPDMGTNIASRFGFSIQKGEALKAARILNEIKHVQLVSLHVHVGSDVDNVKCYQIAARQVARVAMSLSRSLGINVRYLDLGGGYPANGLKPYGRNDWNPQPIEKYIQTIAHELHKEIYGWEPTLIIEPGRYLVDDSVFFLVRILNRQVRGKKQMLLVDGSITMLPLASYRPQITKSYDKHFEPCSGEIMDTIINGASCKEDDQLYQGPFPASNIGGLISFFVVGAYNSSMSSDFIFNKPPTLSLKLYR